MSPIVIRDSSVFACVTVWCLFSLVCCSPFTTRPRPGPDKQSVGTWYGAAIGAGTGAITGAEYAAATGPGAWVGAGFGAIFGMLSGLGIDLIEEDQLRREEALLRARELAWVQEMLNEHYNRRVELHPNRDIYPADWFFDADNANLRPGAKLLITEIAKMNQERLPWSRLKIVIYSTASDKDSSFARYITTERSEVLAREMIHAGVEPRRIVVQGVTLAEPILIDPHDDPRRFRQAVEIAPLDY